MKRIFLILFVVCSIAHAQTGGPVTVDSAGHIVSPLPAATISSANGFGGTGTVTSIALTAPSIFTLTGSPVTTSGTIALSLANQNANLVWAGPTSGGAATPAFRSLVPADIPTLNQNTAGNAATASAVPLSGVSGMAATVKTAAALATNAIGGLLTAIPSSNTIYVDVSGSDSTGTLGDQSKPFLTIGAAITASSGATSTSPIVIRVGPGSFTETTLLCPPYVSLIGSGMKSTIINSAAQLTGVVNDAAIWTPGSHTFNGYFTINATAGGAGLNVYQVPIGPCSNSTGTATACVDATMVAIATTGSSDGAYVHGVGANNVSESFYGCTFSSNYDTINVYLTTSGSTTELTFYGCTCTPTGPFGSVPAVNPTRGLCASASVSGSNVIIRFIGGKIAASGAPNQNYGVSADAGSYIEIHSTTFSDGSPGHDLISQASTGIIGYSGCTRADRTAIDASSGSGTLPINLGTAPIPSDMATTDTAQTISATKTFSAPQIASANVTASTPSILISGTPLAGTGTTSVGVLAVNAAGATAPTTLSTAGTMIQINAPSGFAGNLADFRVNGASTSMFSLSSVGNLTIPNVFTCGSVQSTNGYVISNGTRLVSATNGIFEMTNGASTAFTRLQFGGTTSSFGALQTNGTETDSMLADGSAKAPFGASKFVVGTATILSGSGAPNSSVTGNVGDMYLCTAGGSATTLWVKESGAGTNTGWVGK